MENQKKIILVAHCLCTKGFTKLFSSEMSEVVKVLLDNETGIIQMPCPHLCSLINKDTENQSHCTSFLEESPKNSMNLYTNIINTLFAQVEEYKEKNFEIAGIIGIRNSPVCGISNQNTENSAQRKCGTFISSLKKELKSRGMKISMADIDISIKNQTFID